MCITTLLNGFFIENGGFWKAVRSRANHFYGGKGHFGAAAWALDNWVPCRFGDVSYYFFFEL